MNIAWPKIRVSRVHRATMVRTDRYLATAAGRHVHLYVLSAGGSWVRMPFRNAPQPDRRMTALSWLRGICQTALVCAAMYLIAAFIMAVGPDRW